MFVILAEDDSDADTIACIVRRRVHAGASIKKKGYDGCGALCRKGARDIIQFATKGANRIIVCHDADSNPPSAIREKVLNKIIRPSGYSGIACVVVPVEEIEAWIIADEQAVNAVIPTFTFKAQPNPENIPRPKEWLCKQSRAANGSPLYSSTTFNPSVAMHLRFDVVAKKAPSFRAFLDWLDQPKSIL